MSDSPWTGRLEVNMNRMTGEEIRAAAAKVQEKGDAYLRPYGNGVVHGQLDLTKLKFDGAKTAAMKAKQARADTYAVQNRQVEVGEVFSEFLKRNVHDTDYDPTHAANLMMNIGDLTGLGTQAILSISRGRFIVIDNGKVYKLSTWLAMIGRSNASLADKRKITRFPLIRMIRAMKQTKRAVRTFKSYGTFVTQNKRWSTGDLKNASVYESLSKDDKALFRQQALYTVGVTPPVSRNSAFIRAVASLAAYNKWAPGVNTRATEAGNKLANKILKKNADLFKKLQGFDVAVNPSTSSRQPRTDMPLEDLR